MAPLAFDPAFAEAIKPFGSVQMPPAANVLEARAIVNGYTEAAIKGLPAQEGVTETKISVPALDGTTLTLSRFDPANLSKEGPQPALIYLHGGGMFACSTDMFRFAYQTFALATGRSVFGAQYRLAPEHPYPTPVDDVVAQIRWIQANAAELNVDPARIAVMGQSAGCLLAVSAALRLRDEGHQPPLARLVLQHPALDDRTRMEADDPRQPLTTWTPQFNQYTWEAYLKNVPGDIPAYAVPGRVENMAGLPATYIEVGGLDLFRDEALALATKLAKANVDVELHLFASLPHAFESMAPGIPQTEEAFKAKLRWLTSY